MNSIQAVIICQNNNQRDQVRNIVNKYAAQHGISTDPVALDTDGKYGVGPGIIMMAWFADDRADANLAWADMDLANRNFIQPGSYAIQADGSTLVHHEVWNPTRTVLV